MRRHERRVPRSPPEGGWSRVDGIGAAQLPRIAPCFEHNNLATSFGQARSHGAPARTRTHNYVFTK